MSYAFETFSASERLYSIMNHELTHVATMDAANDQDRAWRKFFGGKVLKISPDGKLLHVFEIAAGDGTTNVAFGKDEKELYVTVVKDPKDSQAKGSIVKIKNVE